MGSKAFLILCMSICAIGRFSPIGELITDWQNETGTTPEGRSEVLQVSTPGPIPLESVPVRVVLKSPKVEESKLSEQIASLKGSRRLYLVFKGLHSDSQPGVTYHLFLDLPENTPPILDDLRHVGILSFFGNVPSREEKSTKVGDNSWRSFEVTELLEKLYARKFLTDSTTITILTFRKPQAGAHPTIDSIALIAQ
jgi:hypothetical protein